MPAEIMPDPRLAVLYDVYAVHHVERLRAKLRSPWNLVTYMPDEPRAKLEAAMAKATALVSFRFGRMFPVGPSLRLVQIPAGGYDTIELNALPPGCALCNVYEHEIGIAEYVFMGMLEFVIQRRAMETAFRRHEWPDGAALFGRTHGELFGKTIGLIGFGHIGAAIAERARAFGMRVMTATRTPAKTTAAADWAAGMERLGELLGTADFVIVCCPLTAETRGLLGAAELALLKPTAVLINIARGEIIDEQALYATLRDRRIAGAVIDVWYRYPKADAPRMAPSRFPFHELDNVIMTPHASCWTDALFERRWTVIAENLDRLVDGRPLRNVIRTAAAASA